MSHGCLRQTVWEYQCEQDVGHSGTWPWVPTLGSVWLEGSASGPSGWERGSGFWFWGRALARFNLLSELKGAVTWVKKKGYATAWVTDPTRCSCAYSYGGRVRSPDNCDAAWPLLAVIWRGIAPLLRPWVRRRCLGE